jgi:triosephosphate isomerase (TIM)
MRAILKQCHSTKWHNGIINQGKAHTVFAIQKKWQLSLAHKSRLLRMRGSKMRKKLVIGNWKLNGNLAFNQTLLTQLKKELAQLHDVDVAVCLPFVYLFQAQQLLTESAITWGAQNVSQYTQGAYTSCVSAKMVAEFNCRYTIVGHSERRALKLESNQVAAKRMLNALDAGITPIFCVGETIEERDEGLAFESVKHQMLSVVYGLDDQQLQKASLLNMVIAYEPVWAIGTGEHATPEQAQAMHAHIRALLAQRDPAFANHVRIIYGGSVTAKNAHALFSMPDIDGGLVGRSALQAKEFSSICQQAQDTYLSAIQQQNSVAIMA